MSGTGDAAVAPALGGRPSIDIGGLLRWAWDLFRANLGYLIGGAAIVGVVGLLLGIAGYAAFLVKSGFFEAFSSSGTPPDQSLGQFLSGYGLMFAILLVGGVLLGWLGVNYVRGAMLLVDGGRPTLGALLRPVRVLPAAGFVLLMSLGALVGYLLCFVGALAWSLATLFAIEALADGRSPVAAIRRSITLVRANLGSAALLWIVTVALNIGGYMVCGVGLIVALPVTLLMTIGGYRWLESLEEGPTTDPRG